MPPVFQELDYQQTEWGELILQTRQAVEAGGQQVYEVKLNSEYLMSSLFVAGEEALTEIGLNALSGENWDVVVGGLGLGYTAVKALDYRQVSRLTVVEALAPVVSWHERKLLENGKRLTEDPRANYLNQDFFELARTDGFHPEAPNHPFDAILLDIDHTPTHLLNPSHGDLYTVDGLTRLKRFLKPQGVFAMWSNDAPSEAFQSTLKDVFSFVEGHTVEFQNPIQRNTAVNGVYVAKP